MGAFMVKELALVDPEDAIPVTSLRLRPVPFLDASTPMYDMLTLFKVRPTSGLQHTHLPRLPPVESFLPPPSFLPQMCRLGWLASLFQKVT